MEHRTIAERVAKGSYAFRDLAGNLVRINGLRSPVAISAMTCTVDTVKEPARDVGSDRLMPTVTR